MSISHLAVASLFACVFLIGCDRIVERSTVKREGKAEIVNVKDSDADVERAIQAARQTVGDFIVALKSPGSAQSGFTVKNGFEEAGMTEHMWVVDLRHENGKFEGRLNNYPNQLRYYSFQQSVEIDASKISDWMYIDNGKIVGGFTIKAIYKNYPEHERRALEESLGGTIDWN